MKTIAFIVGIAAVAMFLLGYLQKKRKTILVLNITSRILYIVQYILLGAFSGALLDVMGTVIAVVAGKKENGFIKKHLKAMIVITSLLTVAAGIVTSVFVTKKWYDFMPIIGILLQAGAFWLDDEKIIRRVSLAGCPFWFGYNFLSGAYPSCIGDALSAASLITSMIRYDSKMNNKQ